ncbi:uncharacterized protein [Physcomitrium patens]|uniref:uncharacterized protein n=1 Tax=Physcomitrium patens TaxID=3218 RepID=UPI003CCDDC4A
MRAKLVRDRTSCRGDGLAGRSGGTSAAGLNRLAGSSRLLPKDDVPGDDGGADAEELNLVSLADRAIAKEYASLRFSIKLDTERVRDFCITSTSKYTNVSEIGLLIVPHLEWSGVRRNSLSGKSILDIRSTGECFSPIRFRELSFMKHAPCGVKESSILAFNHIILVWCIHCGIKNTRDPAKRLIDQISEISTAGRVLQRRSGSTSRSATSLCCAPPFDITAPRAARPAAWRTALNPSGV